MKREGSAIYVLKQSAAQQNSDLLFKAKRSLVINIQKTKVNIVGQIEGLGQHHKQRKHNWRKTGEH